MEVKFKLHYCIFTVLFTLSYSFYGQEISLYKQYNGRYDFLFIGNTLNSIENNNIEGQPEPPCMMLLNSAATLYLNPTDTVEAAYLYWAGSGTGDFDVKLNEQNIIAERKFYVQNSRGFPYFSAFTNITSIIQSTGNGNYTFSDLDVNNSIANYCPFGGNFGGWAIIIIYKNNTLPLNQLNVYDGLQSVPNKISITLNSLNVIDNQDARIGFVAWEGDKNISVDESLFINGNLIDNTPLNPGNNAFNGTNSFTGATNLYNMDLDVYNIQNNINVGDTQAKIELTSNQDFVMINAIVTKLNSQLPDATIKIDAIKKTCNSKIVEIQYTVSNINSSSALQAETPLAIYSNGILVYKSKTRNAIPINGSEKATAILTVPLETTSPFELKLVIDDDGLGNGIVNEIIETNNTFLESVTLPISDTLVPLENVVSCNLGLTKGIFNFSNYEDLIKVNPYDQVKFYESETDLENNTNIIYNSSNYTATTTPKTIYVKVDNGTCFSKSTFSLVTNNCPPNIYNFVSANNDTINDTFTIEGLRDVFLNFKLSIYNRWGVLIWQGDSSTADWDGYANKGNLIDNSEVPAGTYFYELLLNDPDYTKPIVGYLFLSR